MKTKLEMAHEYAKIMLDAMVNKNIDLGSYDEIAHDAFLLADAIEAEETKRENSVSQELSQEEWQPDWSQSPKWANWWAMDANGDCYYYEDKPKMLLVTWMPTDTNNIFPSQSNYQGDWENSLRERTQ